MELRLFDPNDLGPRELEAWTQLAANACEPNPFFEAGFVLAAHRALTPRRLAILAAIGENDRWEFCLPVRRWRAGPATFLATWRHPYCFLGTPLVDRDRVDGLSALAGAMRDMRIPLVRLDAFHGEGRVAAQVAASTRAIGGAVALRQDRERAALYLESPEATTTSRSRSELRRRRRRLAEALGGGDLALVDRSNDPTAWEEFLRLEGSGWKGEQKTAMGSRAGDAAFFLETCAAFSAEGRLRLLALGTGERTAAMSVALVAGDTVFGFKSAFDEQFRKLSPGGLLMQDVIADFRSRGTERLMDSCASPDSELLNRLFPDRVSITSVVLRGPSRSAAIGGWVVRRLRAAQRRRLA